MLCELLGNLTRYTRLKKGEVFHPYILLNCEPILVVNVDPIPAMECFTYVTDSEPYKGAPSNSSFAEENATSKSVLHLPGRMGNRADRSNFEERYVI